MIVLRPPLSTLFPYTTLFRSHPVHLFLNVQVPTIDKRLVPVVAVGPTKHVAKVAIGKGAHRAQIGRHTSRLQSPLYLVFRVLVGRKDQCTLPSEREKPQALAT